MLDADQVDHEELHELCGSYPELPVVLGRTGYREMRAIYALLAGHENFYLDISTFLLYGGLEEVVERFGAGRLVFGTGMPISDPAGAATKLRYAEVDDETKEMIAHGNLEGLLGEEGG